MWIMRIHFNTSPMKRCMEIRLVGHLRAIHHLHLLGDHYSEYTGQPERIVYQNGVVFQAQLLQGLICNV